MNTIAAPLTHRTLIQPFDHLDQPLRPYEVENLLRSLRGLVDEAGLQQGFGSLEEQREALDDMKILAATTTDDAIVAKAFTGIVRAYKHVRGAPRSEFASAQWLERLKEVLPGDEFIPELERDVYGDGWWEAAWRFLTTIFESQPAAEHLPPK